MYVLFILLCAIHQRKYWHERQLHLLHQQPGTRILLLAGANGSSHNIHADWPRTLKWTRFYDYAVVFPHPTAVCVGFFFLGKNPQTRRSVRFCNNVDAHLTARLSSPSPERNTLRNASTILLVDLLFNDLTHFCVYCRVFWGVSRVAAGYYRSFLQLLVAAERLSAVRWAEADLGRRLAGCSTVTGTAASVNATPSSALPHTSN